MEWLIAKDPKRAGILEGALDNTLDTAWHGPNAWLCGLYVAALHASAAMADARSMASYGVFIAACGYEYHGPKGMLGFAPKLTPENFKAPFTVAEGWGIFSQQRTHSGLKASYELKWGKLGLNVMTLEMPSRPSSVSVRLGKETLDSKWTHEGKKVVVTLSGKLTLNQNYMLEVELKE